LVFVTTAFHVTWALSAYLEIQNSVSFTSYLYCFCLRYLFYVLCLVRITNSDIQVPEVNVKLLKLVH